MKIWETEAPDEKTAEQVMEYASSGRIDEIAEPVRKRLEYILKNDRKAETSHTDDMLVEAVAKYFKPQSYPEAYLSMLSLVTAQIKPYVTVRLKNAMISYEGWQGYFEKAEQTAAMYMDRYDSSRQTVPEFLRLYIDNMIFLQHCIRDTDTGRFSGSIRTVQGAEKTIQA